MSKKVQIYQGCQVQANLLSGPRGEISLFKTAAPSKKKRTMASLFEYEKEAIRIKAKRVDRGQEEQRKFSVDPNITSFEV